MTEEEKPKERYVERHFFWMPSDCEMHLAALCAIQDYLKWLDKRFIDIEMFVHCANSGLDFLLPAFKVKGVLSIQQVHNPILDRSRKDFDQAYKFDADIAYQGSLNTEKHATQMFGIGLGSEPNDPYPNIDLCVKVLEPITDILLLPFPGSDQLEEFIFNNHPDWTVTSVPEKGPYPDWMHDGPEALAAVCEHRAVVGVRSGITYLAASVKRGVLEIYPTDKHRNWLSKWANPFYQMIYADPGAVHPSLVYRSVEQLQKKLQARKAAMIPKAEVNA
jgi:hypothetical protein